MKTVDDLCLEADQDRNALRSSDLLEIECDGVVHSGLLSATVEVIPPDVRIYFPEDPANPPKRNWSCNISFQKDVTFHDILGI